MKEKVNWESSVWADMRIDETNINKKVQLEDIQNWWELLTTINTDIALINQTENIHFDWEIYNKLDIYEKEWKLYCFNNQWLNVFCNWFHWDYVQQFRLAEIDWKIILEVGLSWANFYFLENWERYKPRTFIENTKKVFTSFVDKIIK